MSDGTKIEWTEATWNVITGCSVVSAGCKHCYAMKLAGTRLQHHPSRVGLTIDRGNGPVWNGITRFNAEWLDQPLKWKRPRKIFVCAHGDLFHWSVPDDWIDQVFAVMALAKQHTFQVLTKRPERMLKYLQSIDNERDMNRLAIAAVENKIGTWAEISDLLNEVEWPLRNIWLGVSVEDQETADERIPLLLQTPAAVRWVSAEPLLGPVDLTFLYAGSKQYDGHTLGDGTACKYYIDTLRGIAGFDSGCSVNENPAEVGLTKIDWVVVGGESGPNARPMHPGWARSLRDQCAAAGVPFLFKQWGGWAPYADKRSGFNLPKGDLGKRQLAIIGLDETTIMAKIGKEHAGRMLDGVEHNGYPS